MQSTEHEFDLGDLERAYAWCEGVRNGLVSVFAFSVDEIKNGFMNSEGKNPLWEWVKDGK